VDVLIGTRYFSAASAIPVAGVSSSFRRLDLDQFKSMLLRVARDFFPPESDRHHASAREDCDRDRLVCDRLAGWLFFEGTAAADLEILDRIGGGDSFASGII